jgi:hypothetical protein
MLTSIAAATRPGGLLVATLKKGTGEGCRIVSSTIRATSSTGRSPALIEALTAAVWLPETVRETLVPGAAERWIIAIARCHGCQR